MNQATFLYKLPLAICLLGGAALAILTGCSKTPEPSAINKDAPKAATATTAAHGVMHPGARRHRKAATP